MTTHTPLPIAVLASGNGSNFQALIDAMQHEALPIQIRLLLTDNPSAGALARATAARIPQQIIPGIKDRTRYGELLHEALAASGAQVICLAGFMRLLSASFVRTWSGRILNIHPALLPAFPGLHAVRQALDAKVAQTGCTVHFVDEGMDTGPIIGQEAVPIFPNDTEATLTARIHAAEHRLYPWAVRIIAERLSTAGS